MADKEKDNTGKNAPPETDDNEKPSLASLTKRVVEYLMGSEDGVVDIRQMEVDLKLEKRKKRLYDVANVLEGVGLIEKKKRNEYQWKGASQTVEKKLNDLKDEIGLLEQHEKMLDENTQWCKNYLYNGKYTYVTYEDIKKMFQDEFTLAVRAPPDTQSNVQKIEKVPGDEDTEVSYNMHLKSNTGEISLHTMKPEENAVEQDQDPEEKKEAEKKDKKVEKKEEKKEEVKPKKKGTGVDEALARDSDEDDCGFGLFD